MQPLRFDPAAFDAAIIDLDGTLVDTLGDFEAAIAAMLAELRLPPVSRDVVAAGVGWGSEHLVRATLQHAGADPGRQAEAFHTYQRHYATLNGRRARLYPGVVEALERFASIGVRLACVTNKPGAFTAPLLAQLAIHRYFAAVFGGDAFARKKPDPLPLREACAMLGSPVERTLVIGDSAVDAQAARAAGCPFVLVRYGFHHGADLASLGALRLLERIDELFR